MLQQLKNIETQLVLVDQIVVQFVDHKVVSFLFEDLRKDVLVLQNVLA